MGAKTVGVRRSPERRGHNSSDGRRRNCMRNGSKCNNDTKIKATASLLCISSSSPQLQGGVFISQWLTYPLAIIPILPPNCPKYRIFRGLFGNIKYTDSMDYSWPDMRVLVLFKTLRRPAPSTRPLYLGLCRASPPLLRLVPIRPCTLASEWRT